jgi:hypothetical protein
VYGPYGIAMDGGGNFWVSDTGNERVEKFNSSGAYQFQFGAAGAGNAQFTLPEGVAIDTGSNIWVVDSNNDRAEKWNTSGTWLLNIGSFGSGNGQFLCCPYGLGTDTSNNVYVADYGNKHIQKWNSSGTWQNLYSSSGAGNGQVNSPRGVTLDSSGNMWVADTNNHRIEELTAGGAYVTQFGTFGTTNGKLEYPASLAITAGPASCTLSANEGGGTLSSGYSIYTYSNNLPVPPSTCPGTPNTLSCLNGTLSCTLAGGGAGVVGTDCAYNSCANGCTKPWGGTLTSGSSSTAYQAANVVYPTTCTSESRTCTNGVLSGSYTNSSCTETGQPCNLPWGGTINDTQTTTAYQAATVTAPATCTSETRTCNNAVLSGSYTNQTCSAVCSLTSNQGGGTLPTVGPGNTKTEWNTATSSNCGAGNTLTCDATGLSCSVPGNCNYASCTTPGFRIDGTSSPPQNAGYYVYTADINGDGILDLVILTLTGNPHTNGEVDVVFGTNAGFPDPLSLSTLNGTNGFKLTYATAGDDWTGLTVGDFNGDGKADIIIGATLAGYTGANAGSAYVVYGGATMKDGTAWAATQALTSGAKPIDGTNGFRLDGVAGDWIGWNQGLAVADINGDGKNDLIIAASKSSNNGASSGSVYVVYGSGGATMKDGTAWGATRALTLGSKPLDGTNGFRLDGGTGDQLGFAMAAGDINGDGKIDLILGAFNAGYNGLATSGSVYAIYGNGGNILPSTTVTTTSGKACALAASATELQIGQTVVSANIPANTTITNIGVACGSPQVCGAVAGCLALSANASATAAGTAMSLSSSRLTSGSGLIDGTHGFRLDGDTAAYLFGSSVATGDFNGDGKADMIISAQNGPGYNGLAGSGSVWVIYGGAAGKWYDGTALAATQKVNAAKPIDGTNGFRLDGDTAGYGFGWGRVYIGDINGDGKNDLIIGEIFGGYNALSQSGSTWVIFGNGAGKIKDGTAFAATQIITSGTKPIDGTNGFRLDGRLANEATGRGIAWGDVNGDGKTDLIVGGVNNTVGAGGSVYVLFGNSIPPASNPYGLSNLCTGGGC